MYLTSLNIPQTSAEVSQLLSPLPLFCGQPGLPSQGQLSSQAAYRAEYSPGEEILFSCNPGHVLVGGRRRVCGEDGLWTGTVPFCSKYFLLAT